MTKRILDAVQALLASAPEDEARWSELMALKDTVETYLADQPPADVLKLIVENAQALDVMEEGVCEVDDGAIASMGEENGCYVAAWVWLGFKDIRGLDRECPECEHVHEYPIKADWKCSECGFVQKGWSPVAVCRDCGETFAEAGDGYDGRCPSCADKHEATKKRAKQVCVKTFLRDLYSSMQAGEAVLPPPRRKQLQRILENIDKAEEAA